MKKKIIVAATTLLFLFGGYYLFIQSQDQTQIQNVVKEFGRNIHSVPLYVPREELVHAIKEHYAPFVSQTLLEAWESNPERAPGRTSTSSVSSEINILGIDPSDGGSFEVQAVVVEQIRSGDGTSIVPAQYLIGLKLRNQDGQWTITGVTKAIQSE